MKQAIVLFLVFYVFALLQMSFFVHLFPNGLVPNLIILSVVLLSIFERRGSYASFVAALFGGFLLDVFSGGVIGLWALGLGFASLLIKLILEDYVRFPILKKF
ncbi:MAG: rod shape-determining protein MreD [Candidatus Wildermuthbacteria bacterium RIFCSPLOWO2_02_FULL_47_9c]|uniref:Rod shape-determining protein MreD n=3 Tax=Candidatus Wildermuthiibacteriota TaxID=1817923 RepID=A0A1G2RYP1_9BACT|nr:MAG: rod shape-determining protein MreD [Candidatus Wildermuthbacteria bacterium RIFCSPHIGHO2_01_FULL_48_27b]OHA73976.1 MAG: rod shape-determining protein MreD [Candidatus Wildermuthbacteria bacterium RIFCSPLOWO2_01_FULL_48_29]OHA77960.1 MAG: rod shape-determining protein MreD [Candidatus Wildermuthbacteria bacterium RIFCSPLOWO2_02_FULL_47_9c]